MIFDQYQRYKTIQILANAIKEKYRIDQLNILEIGSNEQCNLEKVLPDEILQYSDIELSKELQNDSRFIVVDGRDMSQFEDNKYDIVIALDVLEHVEQNGRKAFLSEVYRVSKYAAIICFPYNTPCISSAEKRANNYYKALFGQDHIWLKEHIDNGLPNLKDIESWLNSQKYNYTLFWHGNIVIWEEMMKTLFASYKNEKFYSLMESIDEIYEQKIYTHDVGEDNYRTFIVLSKQEGTVEYLGELLSSKFDNVLDPSTEAFLYRNTSDLKSLGSLPIKQNDYKEKLRGTIYFDRKNGFSEKDVQYVDAAHIGGGKYRCVCQISDLENIIALRYDPIESQSCIVTKCYVKQGDRELNIEYSSYIAANTGVILLGTDPMVVVHIDENENEVFWEMEFIIEGKAFIEEILHSFQDKQSDYLKSHYEADVCRIEKEQELENYKKEKELLLSDFRAVSDMKDRQINILNKELLKQKAISDIKDEQIDVINKDLLEQKAILDMKDEQIDTISRELLEQKEKGCALEARINKIESTMSWKITKGLRILGSKLQIK